VNDSKHKLEKEELVRLKWVGPFSYGEDGLDKPLLDSFGPRRKERDSFMNKPSLYAILGDHPLHGARSLLYIGQTASFGKRFDDHDEWVKDEWRVEVYLAQYDNDQLREDVEALLIFAHSPHYNSKSVAEPPQPSKQLRVWNEGRYWKLFPEVSSQNQWFQ
jgi:hypothetical protein